jgi:hypothetical protein
MNFYTPYIALMRSSAKMPMGNGLNANHELHLKLFAEEQLEFYKALLADNRAESADALGDLITVAEGYRADAGDHIRYNTDELIGYCEQMALDLGINIHGAFLLIHESNMTKLCTADQLQESIAKYRDLGVEVATENTTDGRYALFAFNETVHAPMGKWLKGSGYKKPDWSRVDIWRL